MVNQAELFPSNDTNRVVHLFTALLQRIIHIIMLKLSFGHVLTVNSGCYGHCYIKNLYLYHCVLSFRCHNALLMVAKQ